LKRQEENKKKKKQKKFFSLREYFNLSKNGLVWVKIF